jgi:hypothetical protein
MVANTQPIYSIKGDVSTNDGTTLQSVITTQTGDYTGVSANHALVFTADATSGGYVRKLRFVAVGTNVATVARIYLNNGSTNATAANNKLYGQLSLPATTASNTAATVELDYPLEMALPAGFRIYVGLGTTVASGWSVTCVAGQYE